MINSGDTIWSPSPQSRRRCRRGRPAAAATRTPRGRDGQIGWTGLVAATTQAKRQTFVFDSRVTQQRAEVCECVKLTSASQSRCFSLRLTSRALSPSSFSVGGVT